MWQKREAIRLPSLSSQKYGFRETDKERQRDRGERGDSIFYPVDCAFLWTRYLIHCETLVPSIEANIPWYLCAKRIDIFSHGVPTQFSEYIFNKTGDYLVGEFK